MTGEPDRRTPDRRTRRAHHLLAAAALLLGLLAALAGEPVARERARASDRTVGRAAADSAGPDSAPPDSAPRRRLDGRRGCAW
ncbi:MAG: hypothetical protein PVH00_12880 [Gemmatimonadota bacterium]